MTIADALASIRHLKPNHYDDAMLVRWLSELDGKVWEDVLSKTGATKPALPYEPAKATTALLIAFPHEDVYLKYLGMMIDYHNSEFDSFNNGLRMFHTQYQTFVDACMRKGGQAQLRIRGIRASGG